MLKFLIPRSRIAERREAGYLGHPFSGLNLNIIILRKTAAEQIILNGAGAFLLCVRYNQAKWGFKKRIIFAIRRQCIKKYLNINLFKFRVERHYMVLKSAYEISFWFVWVSGSIVMYAQH